MEIKKKRGRARQKCESGNKEWEDNEIVREDKEFFHEKGIEVRVKQIKDKTHSLKELLLCRQI